MIKINLLGKKQVAGGGLPFGIDETLNKLGISRAELAAMRPSLVKAAILVIGVYLANEVPVYFHEQKKAELDAETSVLTSELAKVNERLSATRGVQEKKTRLEKEEADLQRQLSAIGALQKDRSLAFRAVDNLVLSLPQKVWLTKLEYRDRLIKIDGACWEYFPINDFIKKISESTQYSSVNFKVIDAVNPPKPIADVPEAMQKIKTFGLDFRVKGSEEI